MQRRSSLFAAAIFAVAAFVAANSVSAAASDNAGNAPYADGWQDGDNGGTGFAGWTSSFTGDPGALVHPGPKFIDTAPPLAGNSLGSPAFALTTSDRPFFFDTSEVGRLITSPLAVGQTFSIDVDGSALDPNAPGFSIGNTVQLLNSAGEERFGLFTNNQFLNDNWVAPTNADTGVPAGGSYHLDFTLVTADTYNMVMRPVGGGPTLFSQTGAALGGTAGTAIDRIRISDYGTGSSADGSKELFFNNMSVVPEPTSLVLLSAIGAYALVAVSRRRRK